MTPKKNHIPAPGYAVGLRGPALCGRYADYATGDHEIIRRQASLVGAYDYYVCSQCLRAYRRAQGGA